MKIFKIAVLFIFLAIPLLNLSANSPRIPVISDLNPGLKSFDEPFVSGFSDLGTNVLVYINGNYSGDAKIVTANNINNFYFYLSSLPPEGINNIFLIARDMNGVLSAPTKQLEFLITHHLETPKVLNIENSPTYKINGQSLNENFIDFYLDNKLHITIFIERNSKNTFYFRPEGISEGTHSVYFKARDSVGRKSPASTVVNFSYKKTSQVPAEKEPTKKPETIKTAPKESNGTKPSITDKAEAEDVLVEGIDNIKDDEQKIDLDEILKEIEKENGTSTGNLTEDGNDQNDLNWNLIIFLLFLVAIVLWIIWVNKENNEEEAEDQVENK